MKHLNTHPIIQKTEHAPFAMVYALDGILNLYEIWSA